MFRRSKPTQVYQTEDFRSSGKKRKKKGAKDDKSKKKKKPSRSTPAEKYPPAPRWKPPPVKKQYLGKGVALFEPTTEQPQFGDELISTTNFLCLFSGKPGLSIRRRTDQGAAVTSSFLARVLTLSEHEPFLEHLHTVLLRGVGRNCGGKDWQRAVASTIYSEKYAHWFNRLGHPADEYVDKDSFYALQLARDDRVYVLKILCEMQFEHNEIFAKHLAKESDTNELRPACFGEDSHHYRYHLLEETDGFLLCREALKNDGAWEVVCSTVDELKLFHEHLEPTQHKYEIKMRTKLDEWLPSFEVKSKKANEHNRKLARIAASLGGGAFEFGDDVMAPRSRRSTCKSVDYSSKAFDEMIAHGMKEKKDEEPIALLPTRRQSAMNRLEVPEPEKKVIDYANLTSRQRAFHGQAGAADPLENVSRSASASRSWVSDASDGERSEYESDGYEQEKMVFYDTILQRRMHVSIKFNNWAGRAEWAGRDDLKQEDSKTVQNHTEIAMASEQADRQPECRASEVASNAAAQDLRQSNSVSVEQWCSEGAQAYVGETLGVLEEAFKAACRDGYLDVDYPGGPQQRRGPDKRRLIVDATGSDESAMVERVWGYFSDAETSAVYKSLPPVQFGGTEQIKPELSGSWMTVPYTEAPEVHSAAPPAPPAPPAPAIVGPPAPPPPPARPAPPAPAPPAPAPPAPASPAIVAPPAQPARPVPPAPPAPSAPAPAILAVAAAAPPAPQASGFGFEVSGVFGVTAPVPEPVAPVVVSAPAPSIVVASPPAAPAVVAALDMAAVITPAVAPAPVPVVAVPTAVVALAPALAPVVEAAPAAPADAEAAPVAPPDAAPAQAVSTFTPMLVAERQVPDCIQGTSEDFNPPVPAVAAPAAPITAVAAPVAPATVWPDPSSAVETMVPNVVAPALEH